jgi:hypothetical protein
MQPLETIAGLAAFERRGPGTDAERRAARWLAASLLGKRQRVRLETFWCRPNWAMAHAWHVALALLGSLLSPSHPTIGTVLLAIALVSVITDEVTGVSLGRRLTPERASQNVIVRPATAQTEPGEEPARRTPLIVTANYDAGRTALIDRDAPRRVAAYLGRVAGPLALGWLAWLSIAIIWLLATAIIRLTSHHAPSELGAIQLPPTIALVFGLALLLEAAAAAPGPAANDNASGAATAIALTQALTTNLPANLVPELVLAGAGEGGHIGIRRHLRQNRRELKRDNAIVLGIAPCGSGELHYWKTDGPLIPLRYARPIQDLAHETTSVTSVPSATSVTSATPHRARGATPAFAARARGLAAGALGRLDHHGLPPRSHQPTDQAEAIDETALDETIQFAIQLTEAIDASIGASRRVATPA